MPTYEGLRLRVLSYIRKNKFLVEKRRKKLKHTDFTIISNNCWGGMVYEAYGLAKQSPTVGSFFMAEDYIRFLSDLKGFLSGELHFIDPDQSAWLGAPEVTGDKRFGTYPIGVLTNGKEQVEIFFLHGHSREEVREKWRRRCERINWDRLLIKFNDQNGCTPELYQRFQQLGFPNKVFFTCSDRFRLEEDTAYPVKCCRFRQLTRAKSIATSYEPFGRSPQVDIADLINSL